MRRRWKSLLSESLVHLAVVLSLLRTDLRVYLRRYSHHPEVQQALLGHSVGLQLSNNYHQSLYPSHKYVEDGDYILNEINRLTRSPFYDQRFEINSHGTVSAWLLTEDQSSCSSSPPAAGGSIENELSVQVCK